MVHLFTVYVFIQSLLCGCSGDRWRSDFVRLRKDYKVKVQRIGTLDARMLESSGLARASDSTFWTHPDSGLPSELYRSNMKGELLDIVSMQVANIDWEDLAQDEEGSLYIGDFGNNRQVRRDLSVYKVQAETMLVSDTIRFSFSDQIAFPPPQERRHYDLEAFFYRSDSLYLFTKSWALKSRTKLYSLPAQSGDYTVEPQGELRLQSAITAADGAPDGSGFSLLGYGRLYLFQPKDTASRKVTLEGKRYCLPIGRTGQAEAVLYLSPSQLLITNEKGKMFLVTMRRK